MNISQIQMKQIINPKPFFNIYGINYNLQLKDAIINGTEFNAQN